MTTVDKYNVSPLRPSPPTAGKAPVLYTGAMICGESGFFALPRAWLVTAENNALNEYNSFKSVNCIDWSKWCDYHSLSF